MQSEDESSQTVVSHLFSNLNPQANVSIRIEDMSGNVLFNESGASGPPVLVSNQQIKVCATPLYSGTVYQVKLNNVTIGSGSVSVCVVFNTGANTGSFSLLINASAPGVENYAHSFPLEIVAASAATEVASN